MSHVGEFYDSIRGVSTEDVDRIKNAIELIKLEAQTLPNDVRSQLYLELATQFLEEAAYSVVQVRKPTEAVQLFAIANSVEREVERLAQLPEAKVHSD